MLEIIAILVFAAIIGIFFIVYEYLTIKIVEIDELELKEERERIENIGRKLDTSIQDACINMSDFAGEINKIGNMLKEWEKKENNMSGNHIVDEQDIINSEITKADYVLDNHGLELERKISDYAIELIKEIEHEIEECDIEYILDNLDI